MYPLVYAPCDCDSTLPTDRPLYLLHSRLSVLVSSMILSLTFSQSLASKISMVDNFHLLFDLLQQFAITPTANHYVDQKFINVCFEHEVRCRERPQGHRPRHQRRHWCSIS